MSSYLIKKESKLKNGKRNFVYHVRKKGVPKNLATFRKYEDALDKKKILERFVEGGEEE